MVASLTAGKATPRELRLPDNIIGDPSFEEISKMESGWSLNSRTSMWNVEEIKGSSEISLSHSTDFSKTGDRALSMRLVNERNFRAVFARQFVHLDKEELLHKKQLPIAFSFFYRTETATFVPSFKALIDIRYIDGRLFHVLTSPKEAAVDYRKHCIIIPAYGRLESLQLTFALETEQSRLVYIDDVVMNPATSDDIDNCELYTHSFPTQRHVLYNYIKPKRDPDMHGITLATQMTLDRFDYLIDTARRWQGPISAAVLLFCPGSSCSEEMSDVLQRYYKSEPLQNTTTLHIVIEDISNKADKDAYPVNFLRDVAIANIATSHVFFVDADIIPGFSEREGVEWLNNAENEFLNECNKKCAYIAPTFHINNKARGLKMHVPSTKEYLLTLLKDTESGIEPYLGVSHAVVSYERWKKAEQSYLVKYREDMEPYFIVSAESAPLINDIYSGYGRDKCAYSRDLHASGFKFIVLHKPFLVNRKDPQGSFTIYRRGKGVQLRMFLNIAFHRNELDIGRLVTRNQFRGKNEDKSHTEFSYESNRCLQDRDTNSGENSCAQEGEYEQHSNTHRSMYKDGDITLETVRGENVPVETTKVETLYKELEQVDCTVSIETSTNMAESPMSSLFNITPENKKSIVIEKVMAGFGTHTYVELPNNILKQRVNSMIPLMQPEAAISVIPHAASESREIKGLFHRYTGIGRASTILDKVKHEHKGPFTVMVSVSYESTSKLRIAEYIKSALSFTSNDDVILIEGLQTDLTDIHTLMCQVKPDWHIQIVKGFFLLKSANLLHAPQQELPKPPNLSQAQERPVCGHTPKVDIILMTRNRPLHVFTFLDSLLKFVSGVNKVWIIQRSDQEEFTKGYVYTNDCFEDKLNIEIVHENATTGDNFGRQLIHTLTKLKAKYVVFAVDEMIWIRPLDLSYAACLLEQEIGTIASFQLRLGNNIGSYSKIQDKKERFLNLNFDNDVLTFYPRRLPSDFGYVINVDGMMMARDEVLKDIHKMESRMKHPGYLESLWVWSHLHERSKQWHLMFTKSRLLNNMSLDGRMADSVSPSQEGVRLSKQLYEDKRIIDVEQFAIVNRDHSKSHGKFPVRFFQSWCNS